MFHKGITAGYHKTKILLSKEIQLELFYVQCPIFKVEPWGKKILSHTFLFSRHNFFYIFGKFKYLHIVWILFNP